MLFTIHSGSNPTPRTANLVLALSSIMLVGFMGVEVVKMFVYDFFLISNFMADNDCFSGLV